MKTKLLLAFAFALFGFALISSNSSKVAAAGCTWSGGSGSNWATAANWGAGCSGAGGIPGNTDDVTIADNTSTNNNISSLSLHTLNFSGFTPGGTLSGNALTITSAITSNFPHIINVALTLGGTVSLSTNSYNSGVNLNGNNITVSPTVLPWGINSVVSGAGNINATGDGPLYFSGGASGAGAKVINADGGTQVLLSGSGWNTNTTVHLTAGAGFFGAGGSVTNITTDGTGIIEPSRFGTDSPTTTAFGSGGLSLGSGDSVRLAINGTTQGTTYDNVTSIGNISLGGATLNIAVGYTPAGGDTYTILHTNGTLSGIFAGHPNGSVVHVSGQDFIIVYTTTDVTLGAVGGVLSLSVSSFTANPVTPTTAQPVTITTVWATNFQQPTGTAELFDGSTSLGSVSLSGGTSVFVVPSFTAGSHSLTVHYSGNLIYPSLTTDPLVITVTPALAVTGVNVPLGLIAISLLISLGGILILRKKNIN